MPLKGYYRFNSRSRKGSVSQETTIDLIFADPPLFVSIHAPVQSTIKGVFIGLFQSTLLSGGDPVQGATKHFTDYRKFMIVSIHAPVQEAVVARSNVGSLLVVSIHAPGKGATKGYGWTQLPYYVSIRAPGRKATSTRHA
jgi:hypothetical protein